MSTNWKWILLVSLVGVVLCGSVVTAQTNNRPEELYHAASQQFWNGEYRRALENYRRLVESYPDHKLYRDAQFGAAKCYYKLGKLNKADRLFRRVQSNHPEKTVRGDALFSLVEIAILQDDIIRARNLLRTFLEVYPDHPIRSTAKQQLILLESTPTPEPAPLDEIQDKSKSEEPPRLKSTAGDTGKPEALPSEAGGKSKPVNPPPMRDVGETLPAESPSVGSDTMGEESMEQKASTNSDTGKTGPSRITPGDLLPPAGKNGTDTPGRSTESTGSESGNTMDEGKADTASELSQAGSGPGSSTKPGRQTVDDTSATRNDQRVKESSGGGLRKDVMKTSSASPERLRKQRNRQVKAQRLTDAYETAKQVLKLNQTQPSDYYHAARIANRLAKPAKTSLRHLNKAIALSDDTPGRYFLLKSELLLQSDRKDEASKLLGNYRSDFYGDANAPDKSRFHFLKGKLLQARNKKDEAFFEYMSAIQTAPESEWGARAQSTVKNDF